MLDLYSGLNARHKVRKEERGRSAEGNIPLDESIAILARDVISQGNRMGYESAVLTMNPPEFPEPRFYLPPG